MSRLSQTEIHSATARLQINRLIQSNQGSVEALSERIREINLEGTNKEYIAFAKIDLLHEEMFKAIDETIDFCSDLPNKYDNLVISAWYSLLALYNYSIMADLISYVMSFEFKHVSEILGLALTAALNPRLIFLQSAIIGEEIQRKGSLISILLKVFFYKGEFNYGLFHAFGIILMETNLFENIDEISTFKHNFQCKSVISMNPNTFLANSVPRVVLELIKDKLDRKRISSLAQIAIGYYNIIKPDTGAFNLSVKYLPTTSLASGNLRVDKRVGSHNFRSEEAINKQNSINEFDEHYIIDNVTRAVLGKSIIDRSFNTTERLLLEDRMTIK